MATSLLTFRDGKMAIRHWMNEEDIFKYPNVFDKVEIWNFLSRAMAPDIFIVAFYVEAGIAEPFSLYGQGNSIELSDKTLGIDAASEENNAEPWIFAPVYAAIRNKRITRPLVQNDNMEFLRVNNIGFTYHVGEEFRHLLSGLRHIDEVVEHYFYKSGDRLGHAIALGTNVEKWILHNDVITIPIMEQLENLLWLWGNMVYRNWVIEIATEVLEGKILSYAKEIYGEINGMTVAYMYYALTYKGYAKERVLRWIDKVRQMGLDSSFIKEEISASQQYREMEELLDEIDRRLRRER